MDDSGTSKADDRRLARLLVRGDEDALAEAFALHGARTYRRALRVLRDPALAEDATQEAFLELWRHPRRFDPARASLATWLCVLAHRRAVDIARREARRALVEPEHALPPDSYSSEELLLLRLERRAVQTALGRLTPRHRRVLELAYYGGLTQPQLAERLGLPLGTVKSQTFEALRCLARLLPPRVAEVADG